MEETELLVWGNIFFCTECHIVNNPAKFCSNWQSGFRDEY